MTKAYMGKPQATTPAVAGGPVPAPPASGETVQPRTWTWLSDQLLGPAGEALIIHGSETYRLRRTHTGKLILTK